MSATTPPSVPWCWPSWARRHEACRRPRPDSAGALLGDRSRRGHHELCAGMRGPDRRRSRLRLHPGDGDPDHRRRQAPGQLCAGHELRPALAPPAGPGRDHRRAMPAPFADAEAARRFDGADLGGLPAEDPAAGRDISLRRGRYRPAWRGERQHLLVSRHGPPAADARARPRRAPCALARRWESGARLLDAAGRDGQGQLRLLPRRRPLPLQPLRGPDRPPPRRSLRAICQ